MFGLFAIVFVAIFAVAFFSTISGFWRMRGMTNKIFTMAEQELERQLRDGPAKSSAKAEAARDSSVCSHCGSRVTAGVAQCPNCGAGLS